MAEYLLPGGPSVTETGTQQALVPGGPFLGETAAAVTNYTLAVDAGTFALTGIAVTLTYTVPSSYTLTAAVGAFTFTGIAAATPRTYVVVTVVSAFAFTGVAVTLIYAIEGVHVVTVKVAPFFSTDTITTAGYRIYKGTTGALTADGAHTTSGINTIPDVTNGYSVSVTSAMVTLDADGGYRGVIIWDSGGGSPFYVADEIYLPPTKGINVDMTQTVPSSNTAHTVGDALNAARAQGFGKWVKSDTTLTLFASDGVTAVRTFTLDDSNSPTQRL